MGEDIIGKRFGQRTVLRITRDEKGVKRCECKCDCGRISSVNYYSLIHGRADRCKMCFRHADKFGFSYSGKNPHLHKGRWVYKEEKNDE